MTAVVEGSLSERSLQCSDVDTKDKTKGRKTTGNGDTSHRLTPGQSSIERADEEESC